MRKNFVVLSLILNFVLLAGCGGGGSSSGGVEASEPSDSLPANFVGVYRGTLNLTAAALGVSESDSFEITITVFENGTVRFDGDEPDETFTVGINNNGEFSGDITINEDECSGTVGVTGQVDGAVAAGNVQGSGECAIGNNQFDVELTGDFTATK